MRTKRTLAIYCLLAPASLFATDIVGVETAALDQPRINAYLSLTPGGPPLVADFGGGFTSFNIQAFFDTGASGVLLSSNTADFLNVARATFNGSTIVFSDVGVGGSDNFNVSQPLYISLAPFTPSAEVDNGSNLTAYSTTFANIRTQIGPVGVEPNPLIGDLDVFGVPLMQGKVVVMDPRPVNSFLDTMRTYVYNPGTSFNASTAGSDPGIPVLNDANSYHIRLSKADFSAFTTTTPSGASGPTLNNNPFIGSNPLNPNQPGDPPPVLLTLDTNSGTMTTTGNFLLDTGAAASMISKTKALDLGVTYQAGSEGTDNPILMLDGAPIPNQFSLTIGGIGGSKKVAGFYLDSITLPTLEGISDNSKNLDFLGAPVLVTDITVKNPINNGTLTLDGIIGMNMFVASASIIEAEPFPIISGLTPSQFEWMVYDDPNSMLSLKISDTPVVASQIWVGWDGNTWDIETSASWTLFNIYTDGEAVMFGDTGGILGDGTIVVDGPVAPGGMTFDNTLESSGGLHYTFIGGAIAGSGGLIKSGNGVVTLQNQNTFTGQTDIQNGTLELKARQHIGPVVVREHGALMMTTSQNLAGLNVAGGVAKLSAGGNKVLVMDNLIVSGNGHLDLADNKMILSTEDMPLDDLRALLNAGYDHGTWNGPGLRSSIAAGAPGHSLGFLDNRAFNRTSFAGETITANRILIAYTFAGDANLDGKVNIADLRALASHWNNANSYWYLGDFNYDGLVNPLDLALLARNWQAGVGGPGLGMSLSEALASLGLPESAVPEPQSLALLGAASIGMLARRRRARSVRV